MSNPNLPAAADLNAQQAAPAAVDPSLAAGAAPAETQQPETGTAQRVAVAALAVYLNHRRVHPSTPTVGQRTLHPLKEFTRYVTGR